MWNPVKELKAKNELAVSISCLDPWNPVKELKDRPGWTSRRSSPPEVESGEGIERWGCGIAYQLVTRQWNPVKELKAEALALL